MLDKTIFFEREYIPMLEEILALALMKGISAEDKLLDIISLVKSNIIKITNITKSNKLEMEEKEEIDAETKYFEIVSKQEVITNLIKDNLIGQFKQDDDVCLIERARQAEIDRGVPENMRTQAWYISCKCKKCNRISF